MTISTERLRKIASGSDFVADVGGKQSETVTEIARELLAAREAQSVPVAVLDIQRNREDKPFLLIENAAARKLPDDAYQLYTAPPAPAVPTPITFSENADADKCRAWAWEQVKKDVTTDSWTIGDSCNFYGFYCWGWDMRQQYNEQRPPAVPDDYQHLKHVSESYFAVEKRLFDLAQRLKGPSFDHYAYSLHQAIDVLDKEIFGEGEDNNAALAAAPTPTKAADDA